jgi:hypothetical protein
MVEVVEDAVGLPEGGAGLGGDDGACDRPHRPRRRLVELSCALGLGLGLGRWG